MWFWFWLRQDVTLERVTVHTDVDQVFCAHALTPLLLWHGAEFDGDALDRGERLA